MLYYNNSNIIDMLGAWIDRSDQKSAFAIFVNLGEFKPWVESQALNHTL